MQFTVISLVRKCHSNWFFASFTFDVTVEVELRRMLCAYCSTLISLTALLLLHTTQIESISVSVRYRDFTSSTMLSIYLMSSDMISEMPLIKWQNERWIPPVHTYIHTLCRAQSLYFVLYLWIVCNCKQHRNHNC